MIATDLKKWRKKYRLTRVHFCRIFRVSSSCLYRWEKGIKAIPFLIQFLIYAFEELPLDIEDLEYFEG